ncbi:hypothetical protein [Nocardioides sp. 503]|uniref:hypothetical protein n=1 Tax=Nocardioides sp. 503 TaxID=2508326 RepID=UPI001ADD4578|nr:hypothetical protein [Nocardioides sp. 503]
MKKLTHLLAKRQRHAKGAAELSVVVVTASLVAGVFFGNGLSRTAVDIADGLTWIGDEPTGEVIQVNPATGRPELRVKVGEPGDALGLAQYDGRLFVTNHTTGDLMSFDLTSILVSGQRRVSKNGTMHTLTHDGEVYLVDDEASTIASVDPVSLDAVGAIWVSPNGLADAAVDGSGAVWSLDDNGELSELRWSRSDRAFAASSTQMVDNSGDGSVLVAHDRGATVFGPDSGMVAQVGTDDELTADAPKLSGELLAPETSPSDIVPVSAPDTGTVVIASPDGIREVDVTSIDCASPATPEVFRGRVYVPCPGDGKVVQLDREGNRAGADIPTPGTDTPELVLDDDNLIINAPGSSSGTVVKGDGSMTSMVRYDDSVPATVPTSVDEAARADEAVVEDVLQDDPIEEADEVVNIEVDPDEGEEEDDDNTGVRPPTTTGNPGGGNGGGCHRHCPGVTGGGNGGNGGGGNGGGHHGGGGGGGTTTDPGPIAPSEAPALVLQKPSNVRAEQVAEGQVQVTWAHAGPAATEFDISVANGGDVATVPGANRQAIVEVAPGRSVSFVVTAVSATQEAESQPSNNVSTSGRPGAPSNVTGDARYETNGNVQTYLVTVRWGAAEPNGSPVSRYDVTISTPNGVQTASTDGNGRTAQVSWSCDYSVDPSCPIGGDYTASVIATNERGAGPEGTASGAGPAQPAPPLPAGNADLVDSAATTWSGDSREGIGSTTLRLSPPADWAGFTGTCEWTHNGNKAGVTTGPVACNATTLKVNVNNGYIRRPADGKVTHSIVFTATNANGTATSKRYTWVTEQATLCQNCPNP